MPHGLLWKAHEDPALPHAANARSACARALVGRGARPGLGDPLPAVSCPKHHRHAGGLQVDAATGGRIPARRRRTRRRIILLVHVRSRPLWLGFLGRRHRHRRGMGECCIHVLGAAPQASSSCLPGSSVSILSASSHAAHSSLLRVPSWLIRTDSAGGYPLPHNLVSGQSNGPASACLHQWGSFPFSEATCLLVRVLSNLFRSALANMSREGT
mmetsp:Transcript_43819/g.115162  ORF Transcript_43819/g.115162 Transcript_43819/m.115162 type:complete len:213 (+) Transcript_43819:2596-3234(+)